MAPKYQEMAGRADYTFGCPEGEWTAHLDVKAWGKDNLHLYFTDIHTRKKYWFSVFRVSGFGMRAGFNFKINADDGDTFLLMTGKTSSGMPKLCAARKVEQPRNNEPIAQTETA